MYTTLPQCSHTVPTQYLVVTNGLVLMNSGLRFKTQNLHCSHGYEFVTIDGIALQQLQWHFAQ